MFMISTYIDSYLSVTNKFEKYTFYKQETKKNATHGRHRGLSSTVTILGKQKYSVTLMMYFQIYGFTTENQLYNHYP